MSVDTDYVVTPEVAGPEPVDTTATPAAEERPRGFQWGQRKDGSPRRKPGRPAKGATTSARSSRTVKPPRPAAAPKTAAPRASQAQKRTDYREPLGTLLGLFLAPLQFIFPLDVMCIGMKAEEIVKVGDNLANDVPRLGAVLDNLSRYTPYAEAISLATGLGVQLAHNHGFVPEATVKMMGGIPRSQLIAKLAEQKRAAAEAAAEEKARFEEAMAAMAEAA
jgi:hypothetical protein